MAPAKTVTFPRNLRKFFSVDEFESMCRVIHVTTKLIKFAKLRHDQTRPKSIAKIAPA